MSDLSDPRDAEMRELAASLEACEKKRAAALSRRAEILLQLEGYKLRIGGALARGQRLSPDEYGAILKKQGALKAEFPGVERELAELSSLRRTLHNRFDLLRTKHTRDGDSAAIHRLREIRREYAEFAGDATRIASMRTMAATFAEQIGEVLRMHDGGRQGGA